MLISVKLTMEFGRVEISVFSPTQYRRNDHARQSPYHQAKIRSGNGEQNSPPAKISMTCGCTKNQSANGTEKSNEMEDANHALCRLTTEELKFPPVSLSEHGKQTGDRKLLRPENSHAPASNSTRHLGRREPPLRRGRPDRRLPTNKRDKAQNHRARAKCERHSMDTDTNCHRLRAL